MRTIKWLKEQIAHLPDDATIVLDKEELWVYDQADIHLVHTWEGQAEINPQSIETVEIELNPTGRSIIS
jgi:hypothetical protein